MGLENGTAVDVKNGRLCLTYLALAVLWAPDLSLLPWTWIETSSQWAENIFNQKADPALITFFLPWSSGVWDNLGAKNQFSVHEPLFLSGLRPTITRLLTPGFCCAQHPLPSLFGAYRFAFFSNIMLPSGSAHPLLFHQINPESLYLACTWHCFFCGSGQIVTCISSADERHHHPLQTLLCTTVLHGELHLLAHRNMLLQPRSLSGKHSLIFCDFAAILCFCELWHCYLQYCKPVRSSLRPTCRLELSANTGSSHWEHHNPSFLQVWHDKILWNWRPKLSGTIMKSVP